MFVFLLVVIIALRFIEKLGEYFGRTGRSLFSSVTYQLKFVLSIRPTPGDLR